MRQTDHDHGRDVSLVGQEIDRHRRECKILIPIEHIQDRISRIIAAVLIPGRQMHIDRSGFGKKTGIELMCPGPITARLGLRCH